MSFVSFWLTFSLVATASGLSALEARLNKNPSDLKARQELSRHYFQKKNYKKVIELLAPYSNEISSTYLNFLADAYGKESDLLNQTRTLQIYQEKEPHAHRPYFLLGEVYLAQKDYDKAAENYQIAVKKSPKHRPTYNGLLKVYEATKQNYEARSLLNEMIRAFGPRGEFVTAQCRLHTDSGFLAEALEFCKEAVRREPKVADNHVYLATTYDLQKKQQAAERVFNQAAKQFPKSEFVQWATGDHFFGRKNYATAARYLKLAVKLDPKSRRSQLGLAESLFELGDLEKAREHYFEACKLDKSNTALEAFRTAASKLRNKQSPQAYQYDRFIQQCP